MPEVLFDKLVEAAGVVGICLVLALIAIWKLYRDVQKLQEKRVNDATEMVEKLLGLNDKWNATLQAHLQSGTESTKVLEDVRDRVEEVGKVVEDLYEEARR